MTGLFKLLAVAVAAALWGAYFVVLLRRLGVRPLRRVLDGFGRIDGSFVWTTGCCAVSGGGARFSYDCIVTTKT